MSVNASSYILHTVSMTTNHSLNTITRTASDGPSLVAMGDRIG